MKGKINKYYFGGQYVIDYEQLSIERLKRLLPFLNLKKTDIVCDFACGNGMLLDLIHHQVKQYYGVDFSKDFIKSAIRRAQKHQIQNYKFVCSQIIKFCLSNNNMFNKAFAFDFTGYLNSQEFFLIFKNIKHSLKKNGVLFIHIPNGDYFVEILKKINIVMKPFPNYIPTKNNMTGIDYYKTLKKIGYKNIKIEYLSHYISLKYLHFLSFIPIFGKYFRARLFITCKT